MRATAKKQWEQFRAQVIDADRGRCVRCQKSRGEGSILHVHHKTYIPGRAYWDYPFELMETLCAGCHAKDHGIISPDCGWVLVSDEVYGSLQPCDYCGTLHRYSFHVTHPNWPPMNVGCDCCNLLTQTQEASEREHRMKTRARRREHFITSSQWQWDDENCDGAFRWFVMGFHIRITSESQGWRVSLGCYRGGHLYPTPGEAKAAAFDAIESGRAQDWIKRQVRKRLS